MNAFDDRVGFEEKEVILAVATQHRAVIPHAGHHMPGIRFPAGRKQLKQAILTQRGQ
jgi:hypothetical protein